MQYQKDIQRPYLSEEPARHSSYVACMDMLCESMSTVFCHKKQENL